MNVIRNVELEGADGRPFLLDLFVVRDSGQKPVVIFTHGFKGFKDYGCWDLVGKAFARAGFVFIKYNFSHNGTTVDDPMNFGDLEAFGNNNFCKELDDLGKVIDWVIDGNFGIPLNEVKRSEIFLIGHSKGGGTTILKAKEDVRIKKIATWAGLSTFESYKLNGERFDKWKESGVHYVENSRTKQQMPIYFQLYNSMIENADRINVYEAAAQIKTPGLIVHGTDDPTVAYFVAQDLAERNPLFKLFPVEGGDHVFGSAHPWGEAQMPKDLLKVVEGTIHFFKS